MLRSAFPLSTGFDRAFRPFRRSLLKGKLVGLDPLDGDKRVDCRRWDATGGMAVQTCAVLRAAAGKKTTRAALKGASKVKERRKERSGSNGNTVDGERDGLELRGGWYQGRNVVDAQNAAESVHDGTKEAWTIQVWEDEERRNVHVEEEEDAAGPRGGVDTEETVPDEEKQPSRWTATHAQGLLLLNLSAMLFGSNQVAIKQTEELLSGGALSAGRFGLAALFFLPSILKGLKNKPARNAAAELGLWLFAGYQLQAYGLGSTTASHGAFSGTFTVLAVPILAGLSGRKIPVSTWIAAVVAIFGVGLLTGDGAGGGGGAPILGDFLCVLSAFFFGVHKWRTEKYTTELEDTSELMAMQLGVLAGASMLLLVPELASFFTSHGVKDAVDAIPAIPWLELAYMAVFTTSLTLWIEVEALKAVSAPTAALIYTSEPLWGTVFAYLFLGDRFGPTGWIGATLIIGSSLVAQFFGDESKEEKF